MIDVVYALGTGSKWENNELRYSLRSVEKYLKNYRNIYIVGERPEWLQNIIHIPAADLWHPSRNILEKLLKACRTEEVSSEFLFINDDHFFLKDMEAPTYPYYYSGDLSLDIAKYTGNYYKAYLTETILELKGTNMATRNFDCHTPILYDKRFFIGMVEEFNFQKKLLIKSIYANSNLMEGEYMKDCKLKGWPTETVLNKQLKDRHIFSTGDDCLEDPPGRKSVVKELLQKQFPNKSKYEY